jgi:hypothetical protein
MSHGDEQYIGGACVTTGAGAGAGAGEGSFQ